MKRKLTIAGIFVGLAAAMVLAVLVISHHPAQPTPRDSVTLTPDGKVVVQPPDARAKMTLVTDLPRGLQPAVTNTPPAAK